MRTLVKATWDEASNTPSEEVFKKGEFRVVKTLIPYDYENATVCYFVEYGEEQQQCGSCLSLEEAKTRINELESMS